MAATTAKFPPSMAVELATRPLRVAVVYGRIPVPMRRADQMTVAHLLEFLKARGHHVDLYTINAGAVPDEEDMRWLHRVCRNVKLYPQTTLSVVGGLFRVLRKGVPVQVGLFSNPAQIRDVRAKALKGEYDVIYTYYFRSAEITRDLAGAARPAATGGNRLVTFLALQLSQTLNTARIAKNPPNLISKLFYSFETKLVARYESTIWSDFTRTVLIGPSDVKAIQETCVAQGKPQIHNYVYGAHGTDTSRFRIRTDVVERPNRLVFSGVMRTPTNVQAVQWFVRNVWPHVRAAVPDATFAIVGREPSAEVIALGSVPGVEVVGSVPDTSVPIAECSVCINSMQAGGGMQNKLLEYLACAKAVVATSVANEGIGGIAGQHLLVADDPKDFADQVVRLLKDPLLRKSLGSAAREFVLQSWTWEAHFLKLEENFYQAIDEQQSSWSTVKNEEEEATARPVPSSLHKSLEPASLAR